jgi:hypothetical protein
MNIYYVYAYLRNKNSPTANAGTPYYIGKGKQDRAWHHLPKERLQTPSDHSRIVMLETNLTEMGAFALERRMIRWYGRKDAGTGILHNRTDGGDGISGFKHSESTKKKISLKRAGSTSSAKTKQKLSIARKGISQGPYSQSRKDAIRAGKTGVLLSDTHRKNIAAGKTGKPHPISSVTCPHCMQTGGKNNMTRWHFENCKLKISATL